MTKGKTTEAELKAIEAQVDAMMDVASADTKTSNGDPIEEPQSPTTATVASAPLVTEEQAKELAVSEKHHSRVVHTKSEVAEETVIEALPSEDVSLQDFDTPQTDDAIKDIVAQEADIVLAAEDAGIAQAYEHAEDYEVAEEDAKSSHPVFWFFVTLLVIIIAVLSVLLFFPNVSLPFLP